MALEFAEFRDRLAWLVVIGMIGWLGFVSKQAFEGVNRTELRALLEQHKNDIRQEREDTGPYIRDKQWIYATLTRVESNYNEVSAQIKESTREIRALRIEIEKILVGGREDLIAQIKRLEHLVLEFTQGNHHEEQ